MIYCYFERLQILKKKKDSENIMNAHVPTYQLESVIMVAAVDLKRGRVWPPLQTTASALLSASSVPRSSQAGMWLERNNSMAHLNKLGLGVSSSGAFCSLADQTTKERLSLCVQNSSVCNDYMLVCILTGLLFRTEKSCLCCSFQHLPWCLISVC